MSAGTWEALRWLGLSYTCTLRHLVLLPDRQRAASQSMVYSTSSRVAAAQPSLAWNARASRRLLRHNPLVRLELHPHDADHPAMRRSWQRLLEAQLGGAARDARWATVAERLRIEHRLGQRPAGTWRSDDEEHESRRSTRRSRRRSDVARVVQPEHHA